MTILLIPEDGNGLPTANCYDTLANVSAYHVNRGNDYWANVPTESQKACIIRATDYIEKRFTRNFRGFRMQRDQALAWPRLAAYDNDKFALIGVPARLAKAMAEYALRAAIYNVLAPDPLRPVPKEDMSNVLTPLGDQTNLIVGPVRAKTQKVGPIETVVTYDSPAQFKKGAGGGDSRAVQSNVVNDIMIPMYPEADLLIEDLLDNAQFSIHMERA